MTLGDLVLFVVIPYIAVGQLVPAVLFVRRGEGPLRAVELLAEERRPFWTRPAWIGAALLVLLHTLPLIIPGPWRALIALRAGLVGVELAGAVGGLLFLLGIGIFLRRRLTNPKLSSLRTSMELAALGSLQLSSIAGLMTALTSRWGSAWYAHVVGPYLWSLARLNPDPSALATLGFWPRAHIAFAFLAMGLVPFTTLPKQLGRPLRAALGAAR